MKSDINPSPDTPLAGASQSTSWQAGTLRYTRRGLMTLFFWLLLGDFAATLALTALPMMLPLHLSHRGMSNEQIGFYLGLGNLAGMIIGPLVGTWSDRTRTRWGRRRPFVLLATPAVGIGMALIPFMESEAGIFCAVTLLSCANAVCVVTYFLYNDVIPGELMGRFVGAFRLVGFGGAMLFQYGLFRLFDTHPTLVWLVCAGISLGGNMLMLLMVREGTYPPPPPRMSLPKEVRQFVGDGLGSPYMWLLWLTLGMTALGGPAANFFVIIYQKDLGMSSTDIGVMMGTGTAIAMFMALPSGWLVDRVGVKRLWCGAALLVGGCQILMYFMVDSAQIGFKLYLVYYGINMLLAAASLPMLFAHLPKERFGQLVGCQSLVIQGFLFIGNVSVGKLIDHTGNNKTAFLFGGVIYLLSPVFLLLMQRCKNPFAGQATSMRA